MGAILAVATRGVKRVVDFLVIASYTAPFAARTAEGGCPYLHKKWYLLPSMESGGERRSQKRIPARIPVSIRSSSDRAAQAETRDISASGIFLYTTKRLAEGSALEMVLMLPAELTQGEKRWICCQAEVIRVEGSGERFGVAAAIRNMDALPEIPR